MKGHEAVIKTRMGGKAPASVYINADGYSAVKTDPEPFEKHPTVVIFPHERMSELDLRFLVGMLVVIDGFDHKRVDSIRDACIRAGARRVISNYSTWEKWGQHKRVKLERTEDTEGVLTWESTDW